MERSSFSTHPLLFFQNAMVKSKQPCFKIGDSFWKKQNRPDKNKTDKNSFRFIAPFVFFQNTLIYIGQNKTSIFLDCQRSCFMHGKKFVFQHTLHFFFQNAMVKSKQPCFKIGDSFWKKQNRPDKNKTDKNSFRFIAPFVFFQNTLIYIGQNKTSIFLDWQMRLFHPWIEVRFSTHPLLFFSKRYGKIKTAML